MTAQKVAMTYHRNRITVREVSTGLALLFLLITALPSFAQLVSSHSSPTTPPTAQSAVTTQPLSKPLLRVNGTVLTERDLQREIATVFPFENQHNGGVPSSMEKDIRQGAAQMMVFDELVYQEALRRHMTVSPEQIAKAQANLRKQFKSPAQYNQFVQQEFQGDPKLVRAKIERTLLIDKLLRLEVANKAQVSTAQAKAYYDQHPDQFRIPEAFSFQSISFIPPQNASPAQVAEARKRAQDMLKQAKATKNYEEFGVLAEKNSDDDFRVMMGDHKTADRSKLPAIVSNTLLAMQPGQVSDIVEFDKNNFTILRLNAHIPAGTKKFEDVQQDLRARLTKDKTEQLRSALATSLSKNAKIEKL
jgi:parvulin-like peptidyl-prolyl cis-trans isomerase-like protein/SurA-like protein